MCYSLGLLAIYPDQARRSNPVSAVNSTAFRTIAVAATIQSGSLSLLLRRSAIVSFLWIKLPFVVRKITALVSSTKRFSLIPFVPKFPLVSHPITVCSRRKDTEISGYWCTVRGCFCRWCFGRPNEFKTGDRSCWYFRRNFNSNPTASGYFNRLFDGHKLNVA